ncbi:hypothetical protein [Halococcus sp. IIIV-5B]|nr:hypothetical protein [Halococcus sp. IIIV-5B]
MESVSSLSALLSMLTSNTPGVSTSTVVLSVSSSETTVTSSSPMSFSVVV